MHPLQITFAAAEGESAWTETLRDLIAEARFAEAETILSEALADLDTDMGELCRAATAQTVAISGWPELAERIELAEGEEAITGLTVAIGNDGDLAFEKGRLHSAFMMLGLYTDEAWAWSQASREQLLAECAGDSPAWAGTDEDLEAFLEITGLDPLNTALIHSKQRHFIREGGEDHAPLRYVDYVVGCWWRALRFHQAVAAAEADHPLPGGVTIVSGMVDMRPDAVSVHLGGREAADSLPVPRLVVQSAPAPILAFDDDDEVEEEEEPALDLVARGLITRKPIVEEKPLSGADLRRRVTAEVANDDPPVRQGFFARLFGRS
jgi:hypothetical protein